MAAAGVKAMLLPGPAADAGAGLVDHRARRRSRRDGDGLAQPADGQRLQGVPRRRRPDRAAARSGDRRADRPRRPDRRRPRRRRTTRRSITLDDGVHRRLPRVDQPRSASAPTCRRIRVAYTPTARVGGETACTAFELAGFERPDVVAEQFDPDAALPDRVVPQSRGAGGDGPASSPSPTTSAPTLAIANDPDADRLGAAIPQPDGSWRRLGGDEIGWLLADHILANTSGDDRLVITTLVSSSLLGDMAKSYGVHAKETFTGFKWIGQDDPRQSRAALRARLRAGARLPRGAAAARQGRHLGGADARRGRRRRRGRGHDAAGAARRHRRPLRPSRHDRQVGAHGSRRRGEGGRAAAGPPADGDRRRHGRRRRVVSRRPTCCASSWPAASACRCARAAPSRR